MKTELLIQSYVLGAVREGKQPEVSGAPRVELIHCRGYQCLADPLSRSAVSTVIGPKKPTLLHLVAKLEPSSRPSDVAPRARHGAHASGRKHSLDPSRTPPALGRQGKCRKAKQKIRSASGRSRSESGAITGGLIDGMASVLGVFSGIGSFLVCWDKARRFERRSAATGGQRITLATKQQCYMARACAARSRISSRYAASWSLNRNRASAVPSAKERNVSVETIFVKIASPRNRRTA